MRSSWLMQAARATQLKLSVDNSTGSDTHAQWSRYSVTLSLLLPRAQPRPRSSPKDRLRGETVQLGGRRADGRAAKRQWGLAGGRCQAHAWLQMGAGPCDRASVLRRRRHPPLHHRVSAADPREKRSASGPSSWRVKAAGVRCSRRRRSRHRRARRCSQRSYSDRQESFGYSLLPQIDAPSPASPRPLGWAGGWSDGNSARMRRKSETMSMSCTGLVVAILSMFRPSRRSHSVIYRAVGWRCAEVN